MESLNPVSLQHSDIEKIAHLARLAVTEEDVPRYLRELSNILQMVEQMNSVDTHNVVPMAHPMEAGQRLRPDEITEPDHRDQFQSIAPRVEAGLYLVPKVIE